ncbi:MAG: hypothetical protein OQK73_09140 [Gammaproteobacteria bacterium]|nr:hypothetical protein [Gammaproteobacteria bacterium]
MRFYLLLFTCCLFLFGCQAPMNVQQLENKNQSLQQQLGQANQRISALESTNQKINADLKESNRIAAVMDKEKLSVNKESTALRGQLRSFVQLQIDSLKSFLLNSNLLDYIGGELVKRTKYDNKPLMLVDAKNPIPQPGVLNGVGGYFVKPTTLIVKVLRKVNDNFVVAWESKPLAINKTGFVKKRFPINVGVEKGDIIGYYFPKLATVSFDEGTGDTRYTKENLTLGSRLKLSSLSDRDNKRAYSLGVYALLK